MELLTDFFETKTYFRQHVSSFGLFFNGLICLIIYMVNLQVFHFLVEKIRLRVWLRQYYEAINCLPLDGCIRQSQSNSSDFF